MMVRKQMKMTKRLNVTMTATSSCIYDSAKLARPSSLPPKSRNSTLRTRRAVLVKGLEGGGGGGGGGGSGEEGGEGGGPSRLRLAKDGIGSLPTDMIRRRPEEGEGERRR